MAKGVTRTVGIYFNGKEVRNEIRDIQNAIRGITSEINNATIGSEAYVSKMKELQKLRGILSAHIEETRKLNVEHKSLWENFSDLGVTIASWWQSFRAFSSVGNFLKSFATEFAALDDVYADVMKYTGMTHEEVVRLNDSFKTMDTRTAREELNKLAGEAGKMGLTLSEDVEAFVRAGDVIRIALGEDLGADAVKNMGKLVGMFGLKEEFGLYEGMVKVSSAINEVAQSSTASEVYLNNFLNRMAGVGKQAGLTISEIIGFGSVLDQNAQSLEVSTTALDKFMINMVNS